MPVTWHFLVRRLSTSSIGMIPLASIPFCVALTDQEHMFTEDIRAGGAILCPIVLGWKLCLSALISFVCARDPRCFSDLITGVGQCRTFSRGLVFAVVWFDGWSCYLRCWCFQLLLYTLYICWFEHRDCLTFLLYALSVIVGCWPRLFLSLLDSTANCCFFVLLWSYTCSCFPCF